jgi:hypothetical protein
VQNLQKTLAERVLDGKIKEKQGGHMIRTTEDRDEFSDECSTRLNELLRQFELSEDSTRVEAIAVAIELSVVAIRAISSLEGTLKTLDPRSDGSDHSELGEMVDCFYERINALELQWDDEVEEEPIYDEDRD